MTPFPDVELTSVKNPRVRAALALRDRRARDEAGVTLVDGARELGRAVAGGVQVTEVFAADSLLDDEARTVLDDARRAGAIIHRATAGVLDRLSYGDRSEGLVAVVRVPDQSLSALAPAHPALVVILEGVEKPGNLGAVLRTADAAGADAVIAADPRTDLFNPNTIRASLGTIFAVPVAAATSAEVRAWLEAAGVTILATRVGADMDYSSADLRGPVAIVLGSEAEGLTPAWDGDGVIPISLPMLGVGDSLNVSITAAVLLYEARRQRG
ncbi:MAG TPA: TrmH family RNA methyltransferase [Candidatus Limnocylindrales bacterium]|nr:TrmH family RNA methyltransferase [Candidatus Limnocylindrales bacterium]